MNEIHEHLSALMDGELERDRMRFLLKRIASDAELPRRSTRYHVARQALRRQHVAALAPGFAEAVFARLEQEPASRSVHAGAQWLRWGAGGAIAASVAVAALVLTRPTAPVPSAPGSDTLVARNEAVRPVATAPAAASAPANEFRPPLLAPGPVETAPASFGAETVSQALPSDPRLQSYLIRHYQATGGAGPSGFVPYVLLGNPQQETVIVAKPAEPAPEAR